MRFKRLLRSGRGVVDNFRTQLGQLCGVLEASQLHFVRCFKPNDAKAPDMWDEETINRQLHASGVLDALRVSRTGYPDWVSFIDFVATYASVSAQKQRRQRQWRQRQWRQRQQRPRRAHDR